MSDGDLPPMGPFDVPRPTGNFAIVEPFMLSGMLCAVTDSLGRKPADAATGEPSVTIARPVMLTLANEPRPAFPVFSSEGLLRACMQHIGDTGYSIMQIDEGEAFLSSLPPELRVIVNPHRMPSGGWRYVEVLRDGEPCS